MAEENGPCLGPASMRVELVVFRPGLAQKPRLWPGLRGLWLSQDLGRAKAPSHGLALARLGPGRGFRHRTVILGGRRAARPAQQIP
jgi:hypothetical protein